MGCCDEEWAPCPAASNIFREILQKLQQYSSIEVVYVEILHEM